LLTRCRRPGDIGQVRLSIQLKLLAGFGVVVTLMLGVGLFAVSRLGSDNAHLKVLASRVVPSTRAVGDINARMNTYRKDQLHYIGARPADRPLSAPGSIAGDLASDLALMRTDLSEYRSKRLIEDPADRRLFLDFRRAFLRYVALTASFRSLADHGQTNQANAAVGDGAGDKQWDKLKLLIGAWNDHKVSTADAAAAASESSYRVGVALILAILAAAVAVAIGVAVTLARRMTRAVHEIGFAAKAIARGEIDQHVAVRSRDELGEMAQDFESMTDYLRSTVAIAESVAEGHLDVEVRPRSERDALGNSLAAMTASLRGLATDNDRLLATSREEAHTDALTGLGNRRALMRDLEAQIAAASEQRALSFALFDLDGFKQYNDTFGHLAGDALLARLADRLKQAIDSPATAYRMGGDEFCGLAPSAGNDAALAALAAGAMSEHGEAFTIGCSYGVATLPHDAASAPDALRVADQRMYDYKQARSSASRQSTDVLLKVLSEYSPDLHADTGVVSQLATMTAERLGLPEHEVKRIEMAAQLHDIGKVAIPETILDKPGPLNDEEWEFMRRHTEIGERIVTAAPSLAHAADLVRSSHERFDGNGYPDRLAGEDIPLGAAIIAVCDAFHAMTSGRPYSARISVAEALAELRRCAGSQFDPRVVPAFCELVENPDPVVLQVA
jgi:diguanylate cyclase (GGDEF)-like protein